MTNETILTNKQRWVKAVKEIRQYGVFFKENVYQFARNDTIELIDISAKATAESLNAYTSGYKDRATRWNNFDKMVYRANGSQVSTAVIHYNNAEAGAIIKDVFKANGFSVRLNDDATAPIEIYPNF